jgi:GNAT superfamily N-acetyltransferase
MKVIKVNYNNNFDKVLINRLQWLVNTNGTFKPYFSELGVMIEEGDLSLFISLDNFMDVNGYILVKNDGNKGIIEFLEVFDKRKGIGTELLNRVKKHYSILEAEALKTATAFYVKNGFEISETYERRDYVVWHKSL